MAPYLINSSLAGVKLHYLEVGFQVCVNARSNKIHYHVTHVYNGYRKNLNPTSVPVISAQQAITIALNTFETPRQRYVRPPQ